MRLAQDTRLFDSSQLNLIRPCDSGLKLLKDSGFQREHRLIGESVATHAGLLINRRRYHPQHMQDAVRTFYDPAPKPVVEGHSPVDFSAKMDCRGVGTVQLAKYIDTRRGRSPETVVTKWQGDGHALSLGHIRAFWYIDDSDAIERVLDGRLNRQSVGFYSDSMIDSITNLDLYKLEWDDYPEHWKDYKDEVDGKLVFLTPGKMEYFHLAYTDEPADPWAGVDGFKIVPKEVQETQGTLQLFVQDSEDKLLYDTASPSAMSNLRKPLWAVSFDFERERQAVLDSTRQRQIEAEQAKDNADPAGSPGEADKNPESRTGQDDGTNSAEPPVPGESASAVGNSDPGHDTGSNPNVPQGEATMDKVLELIKQLGRPLDSVLAELIPSLGLSEAQLRSCGPIAVLISADSEKATAAKTELEGKLKASEDQYKEAQEKLTAFETSRHNELVDRLFSIQQKLGVYKAAELDSDEKTKAVKDKLSTRSSDTLEALISELSRITDGEAKPETVSGVTTPKAGEPNADSTSKSVPKFMQNRTR